jgi:hypothetical protein
MREELFEAKNNYISTEKQRGEIMIEKSNLEEEIWNLKQEINLKDKILEEERNSRKIERESLGNMNKQLMD